MPNQIKPFNRFAQEGICLFALFLVGIGHAAVLRVPGEHARIQNAIDASKNGDVVLVSPGVYNENVNFKGKAITLTSTNPTDPQVVHATVIHASGRGSAVTFATGETPNSALIGFTVTGGYGTTNATVGANIVWGGGIYCYRSSPTIAGNRITANLAPNAGASVAGYGGGIGCIEASPLIARNLIIANDASAGGAIVAFLGQARIVSNLIVSNSAGIGGGVAIVLGGDLINNTVARNHAGTAGNVYAGSDPTGQCRLINNIICQAWGGGGLYIESPEAFTQTSFNNVWNNANGDYYGTNRTGLDGNISQDPQFAEPATNNYRLQDSSPCINAGDPALAPIAGELDFYGGVRHYAGRVDIGAHEYMDDFRPRAEAGPDQVITVIALPALITLDGRGSSDPNGTALSYHWSQLSGPTGSFVVANSAQPTFNATALGSYTFQLIVGNGSFNSFADVVNLTVKNEVPTADAGDDQHYSDLQPVASVALDGSGSTDPENVTLSYRWNQISGWKVSLSDPSAASPVFLNPWPGIYLFELVVNDGLQDSAPDMVAVIIGPNQAPVANAGPGRYLTSGSVMLDGTGSFDPDGFGTLTFQWRQVSGPAGTIAGDKTRTPLVSGFLPAPTIRRSVFELVVSDGQVASPPAQVTVTIVPNYGSNTLALVNPPFNPARPTILAFGGGNCNTGSGMSFGGVWEERANWLSVNSYGPPYTRYGDMLMVYLSNVAPDYRQPIQTIGFSTGNLPGLDVALHVNMSYKDPRYAVNRVALLDAVCSNLGTKVAQFHTNLIANEQCWVDNYISNDPGFSRRPVIPGALNIVCNPARAHAYPVLRYLDSSLDYANGGLTAFAYLSLIGSGKNYQLNTASNRYYFVINSSESIVYFNQTSHPGKVLAPVNLIGPTNGQILGSSGASLSCHPVENAVRYQLLFGSNPDRVMDFSVVTETPAPPNHLITALPDDRLWWTIKAYDQFGSTIYSDPRLILRRPNQSPVADAGSDQVLYAGLEGTAMAVLNGASSTDPDGDALEYTWAWASNSHAYLSNAPGLTLTLPVGEHTVQLMVNDGQVSSPADAVKVTVVAPLQCKLRIAPSTINPRSQGLKLLAAIEFPEGFTPADVETASLVLKPGDVLPIRSWAANDPSNTTLLAFFDRQALSTHAQRGSMELTVAGRFKSGQFFYGKQTIQILHEGNGRR